MQSAAELLHIQPDIACYAKLMTGGVIPLAATLASDAVFEAFTGDSKVISLFSETLRVSLKLNSTLSPTFNLIHLLEIQPFHFST